MKTKINKFNPVVMPAIQVMTAGILDGTRAACVEGGLTFYSEIKPCKYSDSLYLQQDALQETRRGCRNGKWTRWHKAKNFRFRRCVRPETLLQVRAIVGLKYEWERNLRYYRRLKLVAPVTERHAYVIQP